MSKSNKLIKALNKLRSRSNDLKVHKVARMYNLDPKMLGKAYNIPRKSKSAIITSEDAETFIHWWKNRKNYADFEEYLQYINMDY